MYYVFTKPKFMNDKDVNVYKTYLIFKNKSKKANAVNRKKSSLP